MALPPEPFTNTVRRRELPCVTVRARAVRTGARMYPNDDTEARLRLAARDLARMRARLEAEIEWSRSLRSMVKQWNEGKEGRGALRR